MEEEQIENLIARMTPEEKVSLLAGADLWHTVPVERLGIPAIKMTDGPNGARGARFRGGPTSACFPVGIALAATWNVELAERVGAALAEEARAKGAHILLGPTVNIHRSPLAGRHFECYSEDPYLAGRIAAGYIRGLQGQGVGACIKHFVCNDSEHERMTINCQVPERALHEIYLAPFRMALQEAQPWAVMAAYNKVNGTSCSENAWLLRTLLKGEWRFDGLVISDWFATYSPRAVTGGLDLEMPGPARWMGEHALRALAAGELSAADLDDKVRRLLRTMARVGAFRRPEPRPEAASDRPEHRRIARLAAAEAIVLLKNAGGLLPLDAGGLRSLAVIGENAARPAIMGGGSAYVRPHYAVAPLEAIRRRAGGATEVAYEPGCTTSRWVPLPEPHWLTTADGAHQGLTAHYFAGPDPQGKPACSETAEVTEMIWAGFRVPGASSAAFSVRLTGFLTPPETGNYCFGLGSSGPGRLTVAGQVLIDTWEGRPEGDEATAQMALVGGRLYPLTLELGFPGEDYWRTYRLGCVRCLPDDALEAAVALAARSDVAVLFAGLNSDWESEGFDRPDMALPGRQVELIEAVAAANPRTVVVLNTGSPVEMPWLERVPAVLQAWYGGQEAGNAIADVLFGDVNPSGRLPTTFPRRLQDNPAFINYPGECGEVRYGEGIFVGYRYYDVKGIEPLFPFGHGLSYTTFDYRGLRLSAAEYAPGDAIVASVEVRNTGTRAGAEVVQCYIRDVAASVMRPEKELKAFEKVTLEPGEARTVRFTLGQDALAYYDPRRGRWVAEPGEYELLVGSSSRDVRLARRFRLRDDEGL